jgi:hypothetical protein
VGACEWIHSPGRLECKHCGRVVITTSRTAGVWCPVSRKPVAAVVTAPTPRGPGAELKRMLAGWPFYITPRPGCRCEDYAAQMDAWGPDECSSRLPQIVGWLRDEAASRGLPFVDAAGRLLVRRAIARAKTDTPPPLKSGPTG